MKFGSLLVALSLAGLSTAAMAHHSYAMFDRTKDVALSGTVTDWKWTNPHSFLIMTCPTSSGSAVQWSLEGQSPQVHRLRGWNRDMVKVGDKITVHVYPLKDGTRGGQIVSVNASDGHVFK